MHFRFVDDGVGQRVCCKRLLVGQWLVVETITCFRCANSRRAFVSKIGDDKKRAGNRKQVNEASYNPAFTLGFVHDSATPSAVIGCKQSA